MNRATAQTLGLVGALALGAGLMFFYDPDRGALRRSRARRQIRRAAKWTAIKAEKAGTVAQAALEESKVFYDKAAASPLLAAVLPARRSRLQRLLAPRSRKGQVAAVLLGTAIAATGGTLAARSFNSQPPLH